MALVLAACSPATPTTSGTVIEADLPAAAAALNDIGYDQIANSVDQAAAGSDALADGSTFVLADRIAAKVASGRSRHGGVTRKNSRLARRENDRRCRDLG